MVLAILRTNLANRRFGYVRWKQKNSPIALQLALGVQGYMQCIHSQEHFQKYKFMYISIALVKLISRLSKFYQFGWEFRILTFTFKIYMSSLCWSCNLFPEAKDMIAYLLTVMHLTLCSFQIRQLLNFETFDRRAYAQTTTH